MTDLYANALEQDADDDADVVDSWMLYLRAPALTLDASEVLQSNPDEMRVEEFAAMVPMHTVRRRDSEGDSRHQFMHGSRQVVDTREGADFGGTAARVHTVLRQHRDTDVVRNLAPLCDPGILIPDPAIRSPRRLPFSAICSAASASATSCF